MKDNYKFLGRRRGLVDEIKRKGITDKLVLDSFLLTPRHCFVDSGLEEHAYIDKALPIIEDQTISQPFTVAFQTQLLCLAKKQKILEIGTGSGYQAAVLAEMGTKVYSIEIVKSLAEKASKKLKEMQYDNVIVQWGDGYLGCTEQAPFDGIIVTAAPNKIPQTLIEQLKFGGRLIIPVGDKYQQLKVLTKKDDGSITEENIIPVRFVPMVRTKKSSVITNP